MENSDKTEGEERPGAEIVLENKTLSSEDKAEERIEEQENQTISDDEYFTAGSSASGDESTGDRAKRINFNALMGIENEFVEPSTSELIEVRANDSEESSAWTSSEKEGSSSDKDSSESLESDTSGEVVDKTISKHTNDLLDSYGSDVDLHVKEDKQVKIIRSGFDRRFKRITERVDHLLERKNEVTNMDLLRMQMYVSKYEGILLDIEELEADITSLQNLYEAKLGEHFQVHLKSKRTSNSKQSFYRTVVWSLMGLKAEMLKMKNEFHEELRFVLLYIESKARNHDLATKVFELEAQKHQEHLVTSEVEVSSDYEVEVLHMNPNFNGKKEKLHQINILSGKGRHQRLKYTWTRTKSDKNNTIAGLDLVAEVMYRNFNAKFKQESSPIGKDSNPNVFSIYLSEEKLIRMKSRDREHMFKVMERNGFKAKSEQMVPLLLQDLKNQKEKKGFLGLFRRIFKCGQ